MRTIPTSLLVLVSAVAAAAPLHAQVKETQPFGGRPFGAQPGTPPPVDSSGVGTPTGTAMGGPGVSSVTAPGTPNPGTPPTVLIAPAPVPPPPPPPPAPPPAPAPAPSPSVGHQGAAPPAAAVQATPVATSPAAPPPAPAMSSAPAPASMAPPFGGANRNAPTVAASTAQQPPVRGLPADAPKLVISGSVYSPDPAKRMLIVNGQMVREGADTGQGVVVHEVKPESAVLGFKGNNYTVAF